MTYAVSGGVDSKTREQCGPKYRAVEGDVLTYEEFMPRFMDMMDWLASVYVKTLNLIHYMHDKYFYEAAEMGSSILTSVVHLQQVLRVSVMW